MQVAEPEVVDRSAYDIMWNHGHYRKCITFFSGLAVLITAIKTPKIRVEFPTYTGCMQNFEKIPSNKAEGEKLAIKTMQLNCFPQLIKTLEKGDRVTEKQFSQLKLFMDDQGIIRVHGRLTDEFFIHSNKPILFGYRHLSNCLIYFR